MKTYQVEFAQGPFGWCVMIVLLTVLCMSVVGLPLAMTIFPTLYRIVEESN